MIIGRNSRGRSPGSRKVNRPPGGARRLSKLDALDGLGAALGQDSRAHTLASPMPGEKPASTGRWKQSCTIHQKSGLAALVVSFWPEGLRVIEQDRKLGGKACRWREPSTPVSWYRRYCRRVGWSCAPYLIGIAVIRRRI